MVIALNVRLPEEVRTPERFLNRSVLTPYRKGMGPKLGLSVYDAHRRDPMHGHNYVSFEVTVYGTHGGKKIFAFPEWIGLPQGTVIDSQDAIKACWEAFAMKPGDTDKEFFDQYSSELLEIVKEHGETISVEIEDRYGER